MKKIHNKISEKLMILSVIMSMFLFGGYYEFASCIVAIVLIITFLIKVKENKKIQIRVTDINIFIIIFSFTYLVSILYAVDKGMAFLGFLKFSVLLIFIITLMQFESGEVKDIQRCIPYIAVSMTIITFILFFIPYTKGIVASENNRIGGMFQYANTFALFLLVAIIQILSKGIYRKKELTMLIILVLGILFSQSRITLILLILSIIVLIIKNKISKRNIKYLLITLFISIVSVIVFKLNRIINISIFDSTLIGRIIYYKDAIKLVITHPLGLRIYGILLSRANYPNSSIYNKICS